MAPIQNYTVINLTAVIVAVTQDQPRVLVVEQDDVGLPNGPFVPNLHDSLEIGLRQLVEAQTGLDLFYVEQLYTFGNRNRDPLESQGGPRVVSVAYLALTHEDHMESTGALWRDWYGFLPWEDWRSGRPAIIDEHIGPALDRWVKQTPAGPRRRQRQDRVNVTFGVGPAAEMDAIVSLERFELLYDAGIVFEAMPDTTLARSYADGMGAALVSDHRRILASALGRLRGKLAYRPVVFELLPGEFTLLHLQRVVEALSGATLHKQNFRRLVSNADLVESIGRTTNRGKGRPAELFRFRREVLCETLTVGFSRPIMRSRE